jgi:serine/threonine protein kinase
MEECGVIVAKLIDFGLAKRFDGDRANVPDVPGYFEDNDEQCDLQDNDDAAGDLRRPDKQSKLFMNHTQYAPETRSPRNEFTYKSDLWALGTLILWPMLFCASQENLDKCAHPIGRKFPFQALWGSSTPQAFTQERLQSLIQSNLLDKFPKNGDFDMFERICEILSKMSVLEYFVFLWHGWMPIYILRQCNVWLQVCAQC